MSRPRGQAPLRLTLLAILILSVPLVGAQADEEAGRSPWSQLEGSARVETGRAGPILHTRDFGIGVLGARAPDDLRVHFRLRRDGDGVAAVLLALSPEPSPRSAYLVEFRDDAIVIAREEGGEVHQLASGGPALEAGVWHDVDVVRVGVELRVEVAERVRVRTTDAAPLPSGRVAAGSWIGDGFAFADVRVEAVEAAERAPDAERFRVGTGVESVREDWQLSDGVLLEGARAERLSVPPGGRAAWQVRAGASSSLACRFRGGAVVRVGRMGEGAAPGEVWLGVSTQGVRLVRVQGRDEHVPREAPAPVQARGVARSHHPRRTAVGSRSRSITCPSSTPTYPVSSPPRRPSSEPGHPRRCTPTSGSCPGHSAAWTRSGT